MRKVSRRGARSLLAAAAVGLLVIPFILWGLLPGLSAHLESTAGFHWVGEEPGTGHPLLLREQSDGRQIVAGSDRFGIPHEEPVLCYHGPIEPLRDAARARGRIEELALRTGVFHRLTITIDDLGGGNTDYLYRCGPRGAQPLLSWGLLPEFGTQAFAVAWVAWIAACGVILAMFQRRQ